VGQIKSEIVYHGDVLNTTARITSLCSEVGEDLLISAELAAGLEMADGIEATPLGEYRLKGKSQEVGVVAVRQRALGAPSAVTA
jgi:adenylate cyclase